jgi:hypothetical protein
MDRTDRTLQETNSRLNRLAACHRLLLLLLEYLLELFKALPYVSSVLACECNCALLA